MQKRDWVFFFIVFILGFLVFTLQSFAEDLKPSALSCDGLWPASSFASSTEDARILLREEWVRTYANSLRRFKKGDPVHVHFVRKTSAGAYYYWGTEIQDQQVVHWISKTEKEKPYAVPTRDVVLNPLLNKGQKAQSLFSRGYSEKKQTMNSLLRRSKLMAKDEKLNLEFYSDSQMDFHFFDHALILIQKFIKKSSQWGLVSSPIQVFFQSYPMEGVPKIGPLAFVNEATQNSSVILMQDFFPSKPLQFSDAILLHELVHTLFYSSYPWSLHSKFESVAEAFSDFLAVHFLNDVKGFIRFRNIHQGVAPFLSDDKQFLKWRSVTRVTDLKEGAGHHNSILYSRLLWKLRETMGADYIDKILPGFFKKMDHAKFWIPQSEYFQLRYHSSLAREVYLFHAFVAALRLEIEDHADAAKALSFLDEKIKELELDLSAVEVSYKIISKSISQMKKDVFVKSEGDL